MTHNPAPENTPTNEPDHANGPRVLLSVEQAAERMNVGRTTVYALIKTGELETVKVGRLRRIPADSVDAYIAVLIQRGATDDVRAPVAEPRPARPAPAPVPWQAPSTSGADAPTDEEEAVVDEPSAPDRDDQAPTEKPKRQRKRPDGTRAPNGASSIYQGADGKWHGRVTMGVRDDGKPDRRHVERKTETEVIKAVRALEKERDSGTARKAGERWRTGDWFAYWLEFVAKPNLRYKAYKAYESACRVHVVPGIGAHWLDRLEIEHLEKLYAKMAASGLAPATAHQVHRTIRTALGEAHRRSYVGRNVAALVRPPRLDEKEIPAIPVPAMKRVIEAALRRRNGVRYVVALAMGYRQGESLGLEWAQLDEEAQEISLKDQIQRRTWEHGCKDPNRCGERLHKRVPCPSKCSKHTRACPPLCPPDCAKHASSCPERHGGGLVKAPVKSKAGRRPGGVPDTLFLLLMYHKQAQEDERRTAGTVWEEHGLMFCQSNGRPIDPRRDLEDWHALLDDVGISEERLHAARHSFATLLGQLQVTDRTAQLVMGWSDGSQAKRYQKPNSIILRDVANKVEAALWGND